MIKKRLFLLLLAASTLLTAADARGADLTARQRSEIGRMLSRVVDREVPGAVVRVQSVRLARGRVRIQTSVGLSYYPFREESVAAIYDSVRRLLPRDYRKASVEIYTDGCEIGELVPLCYRRNFNRKKITAFTNPSGVPLVRRLSAPVQPEKGLAGRHIALWQSHGRYFDQTENRWRWQRALLWETCEDLYTQGYVLPFLVPMLERAGACVLLPREHDTQKTELLIDNDRGVDAGPGYRERNGDRAWESGGAGFAHLRHIYAGGENPFAEGTVRQVRTVAKGRESVAEWHAAIPEQGEYAVYISYRTTPESADDAEYTVRHLGGESRFAVNQQMGGSTWICLGRFMLPQSEDHTVVTLSNRSRQAGRIVTADAVKIGGGWGNIARTPCDSLRLPDERYEEQVSGYPRFCEGSRYWLQWAGFADSVYAPKLGKDDYKEDYMSRAHWVNTLMGGSSRLPDRGGLAIPLDLALAFHTDAGVTDDEGVIGTLGIFCTKDNRGRFEGGASRYRSRDLTDAVMSQIVGDVRAHFNPAWRRRGMWNRSYYEARVPNVPTMLLELLSHQNFNDMRYGLDPRFRFTVARAVYKGVLRHVAAQYGVPYVVQPLPVRAFRAEFSAQDPRAVTLSWEPTPDPLEPSARPDRYVVYTRRGDGGFDNGRVVAGTSCTLRQEAGEIYSYRVTAVNDGGESFPSETLAACRQAEEDAPCLLIVNGFDRVSGPLTFRNDATAGCSNELDSGVPYLQDISFVGEQRVFDLAQARCPEETEELGASYNDYETDVIGGNTFDYPVLHGRSAAAAGWSFCSASLEAVERGVVTPADYPAVDLILGKQRAVPSIRNGVQYDYRCFPPALQRAVERLLAAGRGLFVSGCSPVSDLCEGAGATAADRQFAEEVLHCTLDASERVVRPKVRTLATTGGLRPAEYTFRHGYTEELYAIETVDLLKPAGAGARAAISCVADNRTIGVLCEGQGRSLVMGFPFEAIGDPAARDRLMGDILRFLTGTK